MPTYQSRNFLITLSDRIAEQNRWSECGARRSPGCVSIRGDANRLRNDSEASGERRTGRLERKGRKARKESLLLDQKPLRT